MKYLKKVSKEELEDINEAEARSHGMRAEEGTRFCYAMYEADDGEYFIEIHDDKPIKDSTDKKPKMKEKDDFQ